MTDPKRDPIGAAERLTGELAGFRQDIRHLKSYGIINRVLVVVDIILSMTLAVALVGLHSLASTAAQNKRILTAQCVQGNNFRAADQQRWDILLAAPRLGPPLSTQQATTAALEAAAFKAYIHTVDAPRDCRRATLVLPAPSVPFFATTTSVP